MSSISYLHHVSVIMLLIINVETNPSLLINHNPKAGFECNILQQVMLWNSDTENIFLLALKQLCCAIISYKDQATICFWTHTFMLSILCMFIMLSSNLKNSSEGAFIVGNGDWCMAIILLLCRVQQEYIYLEWLHLYLCHHLSMQSSLMLHF